MKKYNQGFIPILIGIVIALMIGGGITYGVVKHRQAERAQLNIQQNASMSGMTDVSDDANEDVNVSASGQNVRIQGGGGVLNVSTNGTGGARVNGQTSTQVNTSRNSGSIVATTSASNSGSNKSSTTFTSSDGESGNISNDGSGNTTMTGEDGKTLNVGRF